jgi:hypothetical protein
MPTSVVMHSHPSPLTPPLSMSELVGLLGSCHGAILLSDSLFNGHKERAAALLAAKDALELGGHGDASMVRAALTCMSRSPV